MKNKKHTKYLELNSDAYLHTIKELENKVPWDKVTTLSRKQSSKYKGVYKSGDDHDIKYALISCYLKDFEL
jgi:hypothetical protein